MILGAFDSFNHLEAASINDSFGLYGKGTSRQRSGKGAIRERFPLQKPRWGKNQSDNQVLIP